ncbi:IS6 family transposase [Ralstonia pseudosolanacearum]|uniref:IS6 family transposase n=1 Tax=Ralstonia pseudosolanacearum TaxID=1310165 RepID=UPI003CFACDE7
MKTPASPYHGHRFPAAIISHCVWLYFRFPLSYRDVEEMMAERGVVVSYETIRAWCEKFGRHYAKQIRVRRGRLGDTWHLDEVFLKIGGRLQYLWRAVDQDGSVLDILVQPKRDKRAAERFFRKLLRGEGYAPRVVVTDKLASYTAPCAKLVCGAMHVRDKGANNRAENSHQPTRVRERRMRRFKSAAHAQRFLLTFGMVHDLFSVSRHTLSAENARLARARRFEEWRYIAGIAPETR